MGKTTEKGIQTRAAILEAAFELFGAQGYHATTMRQIAERSDLTPGSIYNHFSSKDDVFWAVISEYHPLNRISPLLAEAEGDTPEQYIRLLASQIGREVEDQPGLLNLTFIEMVELDGEHLPALVKKFQPQLMTFVQRLLSEPERLQVAPQTAFRVFVGLLLAYELTDRLLQTALGGFDVDLGDLDDFVDIYLYGILKAKRDSEEEVNDE